MAAASRVCWADTSADTYSFHTAGSDPRRFSIPYHERSLPVALFGKREIVFSSLGGSDRWKSTKEVLLAAVGAPLVSDQLVIPEKK